ncbi:hypothetical protein BHM03_00033492 [Ensete ventricosum]|nr:hypothetical protein BHM03_00033492 [Ensete ventricosum]
MSHLLTPARSPARTRCWEPSGLPRIARFVLSGRSQRIRNGRLRVLRVGVRNPPGIRDGPDVASWPFDVHHEGEIKPSRCSASSKVKLEGSHPEQKSPSRWRRGGVLSDSVEDGGEGNPNTTGVAQSRRPNRTGYREGQGFVSLSGRYLSCPLVLLMARKRKLEAMGLDEADRTLYSTFCAAANSLSQVYAQAMNQQKISFQAGERHALVSSYRSQFAVA